MRTRRTQSSGNPVPSTDRHRSVLLREATDALAISEGSIIVDATLGGAGHAISVAERLGTKGVFIGIDADKAAIERARQALQGFKPAVCLLHGNFRGIENLVREAGYAQVNGVLFDLGWSAFQLSAGRGFSFQKDEPLLMTYDSAPNPPLTARTIVNEWAEESLADIIYGWGQERYARRIAKAIVTHREKHPIETTRELVDVIFGAVPAVYRHGRIHPATRTFQALRIAVNDELGVLEEGLYGAWSMLRKGGRIAVITFHSTEDRIVKRRFLSWEESGEGTRITRKAIRPSEGELAENPRARSAKLRVIEKK